MFTETAAALLIIGFLAGVVFMQLTAVRSLERETRKLTTERRRETRQAVYRQAAREHHGTPYIASYPTPTETMPWHSANDIWSRKALPENVTRIGASR